MIRIEKEAIIDAPLEKVFHYVQNPGNLPEIWPGLVRVYNIQHLNNGGYTAEYVFKLAGINLRGKAECTELILNKSIVIKTRGISHSSITGSFNAVHSNQFIPKTRISVTIEYEVPIPLLGSLTELAVKKINITEADLFMINIQTKLMKA